MYVSLVSFVQIERTSWQVYLDEVMEEPLESIWAYLQKILPEADLVIFKGHEELFVKAIPVLAETVNELRTNSRQEQAAWGHG